jgi:hypothetical protein
VEELRNFHRCQKAKKSFDEETTCDMAKLEQSPELFVILEAATWEDKLSLDDVCPWVADGLIVHRAATGVEMRKRARPKDG